MEKNFELKMEENLTARIQKTFDNYDDTSIEIILELLNEIKNNFHSELTKTYLAGKLNELRNQTDDSKKITLAKKLKPYFDWYLAGKNQN